MTSNISLNFNEYILQGFISAASPTINFKNLTAVQAIEYLVYLELPRFKESLK